MAFKRWMYRGGRPNIFAKIQNRGWAILHSLGIFPARYVTLELAGRKSGKTVSLPLAMTVVNGERYLVSMLGEETNWVRNVRAANGKARLVHGISEQVFLEEVDIKLRAPILKAYLQIAPGARAHIPIHKDATIPEFEKIVSKYPIFRIETINQVSCKGGVGRLYRKMCLKRQTELRRLMMSANDHDLTVQIFLSQHAMLHSRKLAQTEPWFCDHEVFQDIPDEQIREIPPGGEHSIAWLTWHMARCEDITMNLLVAGSPQILYRDGWLKPMRI